MDTVGVEPFLHQEKGPIIDVRSPCEFASGHIPGSISFPLFTDEERACVGTTYKQKGHDEAVLCGFTIVGPKLGYFVTQLRSILGGGEFCRILCYRGGMRSASIEWLCTFLRFRPCRLKTGYKGYREYVFSIFTRPYSFVVLGGYTGSGKTQMLHALQERGCQVLDLEKLAQHKGSAFGLLPGQFQPTIEQFENEIAFQLGQFDSTKPIFVEDESRTIGSCVIPKSIYDLMAISPMVWLEKDKEDRIEGLCALYGSLPKTFLIESVRKLEKRLGSQRTSTICQCIDRGQIRQAAIFLLEYYDATYEYIRQKKNRPYTVVKSISDMFL